jgi:hypothetical protein
MASAPAEKNRSISAFSVAESIVMKILQLEHPNWTGLNE